MPDIYDPERGLKIGLTDEDYENYQNGNLSDDFYARRTDGSIANRVTISPLDDDNDEDGEPSGGIDPGSAVIGALIMATIAGATYGIKKLWDRHKAKKAETQVNTPAPCMSVTALHGILQSKKKTLTTCRRI